MNTAAFLHGARDVRIEKYQSPDVGSAETLLKVAAVGICGSDLHYYKDGGIGSAQIKQPFVPGHEFSGWLTEDLPELALGKGELVAVDPASPCHQCEWCERGYHNLCPQVVFLGAPPYQGALTQEIVVPRRSIVKIPEHFSAPEAAMLEPLGVCIHALDLARVRVMESVAVLGCGGIGLGIIQLLQNSSCGTVLAIDPQEHRAQRALACGATAASTSLSMLTEHTNDRGCDLVIEATNSPDAFSHAIKAAAIGGRLVMVGIPDGDWYSSISASEARRRGVDIRFSRRMGNVYSRAVELVDQKKVDVNNIISHHIDLDSTPKAFEWQASERKGLIKSMVYPGRLPAGVTLNA